MNSRILLQRTDSGRRLFLADPWLRLKSEDYAGIRWPACLIVADHPVDPEAVRSGFRELLRAGATYACFSAPNATELHALFDTIDLDLKDSGDIPEGRGDVAMTIGENGSDMDDVFFHFAACAFHGDHDQFDRLLLPLGLPAFKEDIQRRILESHDF